jgi:hypothetical protein
MEALKRAERKREPRRAGGEESWGPAALSLSAGNGDDAMEGAGKRRGDWAERRFVGGQGVFGVQGPMSGKFYGLSDSGAAEEGTQGAESF